MIFSTAKASKIDSNDITLDYILSKVSEYDIYRAYIGEFKVGMIYNSPFRKDKTPSFGIFQSRNKQLMFKDHGTGDCGNVIKFVGLYTGLTNYSDILKDIVSKLNITNKTKLVSSKHHIPEETVIGIVRQDFTAIDIDYWSQFNISKNVLKKFNVFSIKYYLCNGVVKGIYRDENPMYAYKVNDHFKIYRPKANKFSKWRNNLEQRDIQGYAQLPENGKILIITKSMKDIMCLYTMGIPAISPSAESTFIPDKALEILKERFDKIVVLFDNDEPGINYANKLKVKYGLETIFIPEELKGKDVSDAIVETDFNQVKTWIKQKIKEL